ncbi:MAG: hypothetical protein QOG73_3079, partial [Acetobacteraceae bacterium]|nr:hypothetical protein [Acetobacteraceae bacterium]
MRGLTRVSPQPPEFAGIAGSKPGNDDERFLCHDRASTGLPTTFLY